MPSCPRKPAVLKSAHQCIPQFLLVEIAAVHGHNAERFRQAVPLFPPEGRASARPIEPVHRYSSGGRIWDVQKHVPPDRMPRVAALSQIVSYANEHLRIRAIDDWPNALNGLQVENSGAVTKIGAAVDASARSINDAIQRGVNFLVVPPGLFWPGLQSISGGRRRLLEQIFRSDLALYSAHLPLDVHFVLGNNAQLAASLGFEQTEPFFEAKGQRIGLRAETQLSREELATRLEQSL